MIPFTLAVIAASVLIGWLSAIVVFQQPQPSDLITFQWVAIVTLAGIVPVLYWQNTKLRDKHEEQLLALIKGYSEALQANTQASKDVARTLEDAANLGKVENQIAQLEARLGQRQRS